MATESDTIDLSIGYEASIENCDIGLLQCLLEAPDPGLFVEKHRIELALLFGKLMLIKHKDEYHRRKHKIERIEHANR